MVVLLLGGPELILTLAANPAVRAYVERRADAHEQTYHPSAREQSATAS
jgi:hypothetical protein